MSGFVVLGRSPLVRGNKRGSFAVAEAGLEASLSTRCVVEQGTLEVLLARQQGIYAHLWRMQDGGKPTETIDPTDAIAVTEAAVQEAAS